MVAPRNDSRAPSLFDERLAREATSAEKPNEATLTKQREAVDPSSATKRARPTSMRRTWAFFTCTAACATFRGRQTERRKSPPVPRGMMPSSVVFPAATSPSTTSEMVPSPPKATTELTACAGLLLGQPPAVTSTAP